MRVAVEAAVAQLKAIDRDDPEVAHAHADVILLGFVPSQIREAYLELVEECSWFASA